MIACIFGIFLIVASAAAYKLVVCDCNEPLMWWWPAGLFMCGVAIILIRLGAM